MTLPSQPQGKGRRVVVALAALAATGLTVWLGCWQLGRAETKAALANQVAHQANLPTWTVADWPCAAPAASTLPLQRPVRLRGQWLHERTVRLGERAACPGATVLVQRGWLPRDPAAPRDAAHLPAVPRPLGLVEVHGRLVAEPSRVYSIAQEPPPEGAGPVLRQNVDPGFWAAWLGQSPLAGTVLQLQAEAELARADATAPEAPAGDGLWRQWPAVDHGQGKHLGYAVQWFALAALITGLYVWHQLIRPRRTADRTLAHVDP
jgi:surfeit locus 1 family protein